jgi:transglutaminase-like putative cysteine protease
MLYDITASIDYAYNQPSVLGRTLLRLMPVSLPGVQRLIAGTLTTQPAAAERIDRVDFFGNPVTELAFRDATRSASFRIQARVERIVQTETEGHYRVFEKRTD